MCRYFKRSWSIFVALTVVIVSAAVEVSAHRCIHDSAEIQALPQAVPLFFPEDDAAQQQHHRAADELAAQQEGPVPIRFNVSTIDLFNESRYCHTINQTVMTFKDAFLNCTTEADIFTAEKRDALLNHFLPEALRRMSTYLSVHPLHGGTITGLKQDTAYPFTLPESWYTVPPGQDNATVIADFALVVAAGPTPVGNIGWAGTVAYASGPGAGINSGRPVAGKLNVGPHSIKSSSDPPQVQERYIGSLVHELCHALGYSWTHFQNNYRVPNSTAVVHLTHERGGAPNYVLNHTVVRDAVSAFYGCANATGLLLENEGGGGTANSHIERVIAYGDLMTGVEGVADRMSNVTLAVFASMGYYVANFSAAEDMYFGKGAGCSFLREKCNSPNLSPRARELFCFEFSESTLACSYNLKFPGRCTIANFSGPVLPDYWNYYGADFPSQGGAVQLFDYCPFTQPFPSLQCNVGNISSGSSGEQIIGYTYGPSSRCVNAPSLVKVGFLPYADPNRCLSMRCVYDNCSGNSEYHGTESPHLHGATGCAFTLQVKVRDTEWQSCNSSGAAGVIPAPAGFNGELRCPRAFDICDLDGRGYGDDISFVSASSFTTTTSTTTSTTSTTTSSTTTSTTSNETETSTTTSSAQPGAATGAGGSGSASSSGSAAGGGGGTSITTMDQTPPPSLSPPPVPGTLPPATTTTTVTATGAPLETLGTTASTKAPGPPTSAPPPPPATTVAAVVTTTTSSAASGGGASVGDGVDQGSPCFLTGLPCFVSYILLSLAGIIAGLILYATFQKLCGGSGGEDKKDDEKPRSQRQQQQQQPSRSEPLIQNKYQQMAQEMKTKPAAAVAAASAPSPLMSPQARAISPSQQQLSPRAAPIAYQRSAPTFEIDDDL